MYPSSLNHFSCISGVITLFSVMCTCMHVRLQLRLHTCVPWHRCGSTGKLTGIGSPLLPYESLELNTDIKASLPAEPSHWPPTGLFFKILFCVWVFYLHVCLCTTGM